MTRSVICISHETGAGGPGLARALAERLRYRYVDEEVLARAAEAERVSIAEIVDVERRKSFFARLITDFGRSGGPMYHPAAIPAEWTAGVPTSDQLRGAIRGAIEDLATEGRVVITSHAASHALVGDHVLRVLVVAPSDARAAAIAEAGGMDLPAARKRIADDDAGRRDYLKRFYDVERESPVQYDLVVNTGGLDQAALLTLLVSAVEM